MMTTTINNGDDDDDQHDTASDLSPELGRAQQR